MEFAKAVIQEVTAGAASPTPVGEPVVVQINPATLRVQMASSVDFGKDTGRQKIQYQGSTSTLSFDLVLDTADEGTTERPVDVRDRTRQLERFVLPAMAQAKAVPPRLRFTYGSFSVVGVMTVLNQDFDFFARNGVPLRAKCAVTIKEQKPEFDASRSGPGANTGAGAIPPVPPGTGGAGPGRPQAGGTGPAGQPAAAPADRTGTAVAGESAADFAARMGLDPRAWKGLEGITDPARLPAGLQIDFSSVLTPAPGLGVEPAVAAAPVPAGPPAAARPAEVGLDGPALATAGGLTAVLERGAASNAAAAAAAARAGFGPSTPGASTAPAGPTSIGSASTGSASTGPRRTAAPFAAAQVDPRSLGWGYGVPLRPVAGRRAVGDAPPETDDPTVPRWRALPGPGPGAQAGARASGCRCGP